MQRLAEAREVAVTEDAEAAGEEAPALAVALDLLHGEESHQRLGDGQSHARTSSKVSSSRASWSASDGSSTPSAAAVACASRLVSNGIRNGGCGGGPKSSRSP